MGFPMGRRRGCLNDFANNCSLAFGAFVGTCLQSQCQARSEDERLRRMRRIGRKRTRGNLPKLQRRRVDNVTWAEKWKPKPGDEDLRPVYLTWEQIETALLNYNRFCTRSYRITTKTFCELIDVRLIGE